MKTDKAFDGIELHPQRAAITLQKIRDLTGITPTLLGAVNEYGALVSASESFDGANQASWL